MAFVFHLVEAIFSIANCFKYRRLIYFFVCFIIPLRKFVYCFSFIKSNLFSMIAILLHPIRLSMGIRGMKIVCLFSYFVWILNMVFVFVCLSLFVYVWVWVCAVCREHNQLPLRQHDSAEPQFDLWQFHAYVHELYAVWPCCFA